MNNRTSRGPAAGLVALLLAPGASLWLPKLALAPADAEQDLLTFE